MVRTKDALSSFGLFWFENKLVVAPFSFGKFAEHFLALSKSSLFFHSLVDLFTASNCGRRSMNHYNSCRLCIHHLSSELRTTMLSRPIHTTSANHHDNIDMHHYLAPSQYLNPDLALLSSFQTVRSFHYSLSYEQAVLIRVDGQRVVLLDHLSKLLRFTDKVQ